MVRAALTLRFRHPNLRPDLDLWLLSEEFKWDYVRNTFTVETEPNEVVSMMVEDHEFGLVFIDVQVGLLSKISNLSRSNQTIISSNSSICFNVDI